MIISNASLPSNTHTTRPQLQQLLRKGCAVAMQPQRTLWASVAGATISSEAFPAAPKPDEDLPLGALGPAVVARRLNSEAETLRLDIIWTSGVSVGFEAATEQFQLISDNVKSIYEDG